MGGVNYDCFLAAIARPIHLAKAEAARDSAAITRLQAGSQGLYAPSGRMVPVQYHLTPIRPIHESMERSGRI